MRIFILLFISTFAVAAQAQDVHFTQWGFSAWALNPASQVAMPELTRATAQHRKQWAKVPVPFQTTALTIEQRGEISDNDGWGAGVTVLQDQSGDSKLTWQQGLLTLGYTRKLNRSLQLSGALQPAFLQRRFNDDDLTFGEQYNGEYYVPGAATGESFEAYTRSFFSLGAGLLLRFSPTALGPLKMAEMGFAATHLNSPEYAYTETTAAPLRGQRTIHAAAVVGVAENTEIPALLLYKSQGAYQQTLIMTGIRQFFSLGAARLQAELGAGLRLGDAYFGAVTMRYGAFQVGYSFDSNFSDFKTATGGNGGPEIGIRYSILPVLMPKSMKVCPVF